MTDSQCKLRFDPLKAYFMEPYSIPTAGNEITISQPTIGDIIDFGEREFFLMLKPFTDNPTSYRLFLWDAGLDWNKMSDYELFCALISGVHPQDSSLIFGDLDFTKFKLYNVPIKGEAEQYKQVLMNIDQGVVIDEETYKTIAEYLRWMFNIYPKVEKAKGKNTKLWIIDEERQKYEKEKNNPNNDSMLLPLISGCLNHPGFKYKRSELREVGIVEFMDSVRRLRVYEEVRALTNGRYSGMIDTSKIKDEAFDFMRDLNKRE